MPKRLQFSLRTLTTHSVIDPFASAGIAHTLSRRPRQPIFGPFNWCQLRHREGVPLAVDVLARLGLCSMGLKAPDTAPQSAIAANASSLLYQDLPPSGFVAPSAQSDGRLHSNIRPPVGV